MKMKDYSPFEIAGPNAWMTREPPSRETSSAMSQARNDTSFAKMEAGFWGELRRWVDLEEPQVDGLSTVGDLL
jgi:hypothetical protein